MAKTTKKLKTTTTNSIIPIAPAPKAQPVQAELPKSNRVSLEFIKPDAKPVVVKAFSKEYFELLKSDKTLGPVLALGGKILVAVKDTVYQIEE